jgi:hypothetical protein
MFKQHTLKQGNRDWCIKGIVFKERGQKKVEWQDDKCSDKKGIESLLQALQE